MASDVSALQRVLDALVLRGDMTVPTQTPIDPRETYHSSNTFIHPSFHRDASDPQELRRRLELLAWHGNDSDTDTDDDEWIAGLNQRIPYYNKCIKRNNKFGRDLIKQCEMPPLGDFVKRQVRFELHVLHRPIQFTWQMTNDASKPPVGAIEAREAEDAGCKTIRPKYVRIDHAQGDYKILPAGRAWSAKPQHLESSNSET